MTFHRFYCPELSSDQKIILIRDPQEIHHAKNVLRLKKGGAVRIFNGQGLEAQGVIRSLSKDSVEIETSSFLTAKPSHPVITIACAIPKRSKFETIIEKCTELGADEIIPLKTSRTEIKESINGAIRQNARYQEVAINACKQCGRSFLPKIHTTVNFFDALDQISANDLALIGHIREKLKKLPDLKKEDLRTKNRILVFVGPEGDFDENEISTAIQRGCVPITLGPNILKVETAVFAAISYLTLILRS